MSLTEVGWHGISSLRTQAYGLASDGEIVRLLVGGGSYFIYLAGELIGLDGNFDGINYISRSQGKFFLSRRSPASAWGATPVFIIDDSGRMDSQIKISGPCSKILVDPYSRVWVGYSDSGSLPIPDVGSSLSGFESEGSGYDFPGVVCWNESGVVSWRMKDHDVYSGRFLHCHAIGFCEDRVLALVDQGNSVVSIGMNGEVREIETPVLAPLGIAVKGKTFAFLGKYELAERRGYRDREVFIFEINGYSVKFKEVRLLKIRGSDIPGTPKEVLSFENSIFMHFGDRDHLYVMRLE
ncbi:hypothetical protein PWG71_15990 [Nocardiopsis sp. N85]|uniref:hypothetical protein n=1 Tax=Nocardiopsis sp. N85 TaxID=3029400 RepID=UPI00237F9430|nr:hypothetical protein [Nocardiopsis sp. N85]MDE3722891.1 hypothetical protein [Nocardiopsis sp. N85]